MDKRKIIRYSLLLLIAATLIFIFTNSLLPPEVSSEESDAVSEILEVILPEDTEIQEFVIGNIRKIAHFTEFAVLGAEIFALLALESLSIGKCGMYTSFGSLFLAFIDETLQIFSKRGPTILDVWIDFLGAACSILLGLIILFLINFFSHRKEKGDTNG